MVISVPLPQFKGLSSAKEAAWLRERRLALGLSVREAASVVGCSERAWQGWEAGTYRVHKRFQMKVARLLGHPTTRSS